MVVGLIREGVPVLRAVRMAGLSRRTHHEYMARGEGRHERGSTPVLKDYAERVGRAIEESIGLAEAKLFESGHIRYWLQRRDSEQGEDGQGGLIERAALSVIGEEELVAECFRMLRFLLEDGTINVPPCSDAHCRCRWHEAKEPPGARPVGTGKTSTRANGRRAR